LRLSSENLVSTFVCFFEFNLYRYAEEKEQTTEQAGRYRLDAAQLAETFARARARVSRDAAGGWRYDSLDAFTARATRTPAGGWRRVIIFCDNAGADAMGMVLLAKAGLAKFNADDP
jgi:hypothetical protein